LTIECTDLEYSGDVLCPAVCPKAPPADGDEGVSFCDFDNRFTCGYGDAVVCDGDPAYFFPYELECYCFNNTFFCVNNTNGCPDICPENPPVEGDNCYGYLQSGGFYDLGCNYGELCCPGKGGKCIPDRNCGCPLFTISCGDATDSASLPCPSVCPRTPPKTNDTCDIDRRYACRYGGPLQCNADIFGYSVYKKQCYCNNGKFICESNSCPPVACPETQPVDGAVCSPFVGGSCDYFNQPCCAKGRGGGGVLCVANSTCSCDGTDNKVKCSELPIVFCPAQGNLNNTAGGNGQMNGKNKKVKKPTKNKKKIKQVVSGGG
jgi:hypothetical protein